MIDPLLKTDRERWQAVEEIEKKEQRVASIALRWQQTNAILRLAIGLGLQLDNSEKQEEIVRQRWEKLKGLI